MTRLPLLIPTLGAVMATVAVMGLRDISPYAVAYGLLGYFGIGLVVAFLVGWPQVEVTEGRREP